MALPPSFISLASRHAIRTKTLTYAHTTRYKEAVKECTSALEVAPNSVRALQRRAKAFEQQGLYKEALADVTAINKTDLASPETQEQERRLREAAARGGAAGAAAARPRSAVAPGARAAGAGGGSAVAAAAQNNKLQNLLQQGVFVAKATLGDDTKLVHLSLSNSYADVLAAVQQKFPSAGERREADAGGQRRISQGAGGMHMVEGPAGRGWCGN